MVPSPTLCHNPLKLFIDRLSALRLASLLHSVPAFDSSPPLSAALDEAEPISLPLLSDVVKHLQTTNCPSDSNLSRPCKELFAIWWPQIPTTLNSSLMTYFQVYLLVCWHHRDCTLFDACMVFIRTSQSNCSFSLNIQFVHFMAISAQIGVNE